MIDPPHYGSFQSSLSGETGLRPTFDVGVFLNISLTILEPIEHPTFEDYFYHKRLLMKNSQAVVNSDMDHFKFSGPSREPRPRFL